MMDADNIKLVIFDIDGTLVDAYSAMVKRLTARYYSRVTRYGSGGFLKARLAAGKKAAAQ